MIPPVQNSSACLSYLYKQRHVVHLYIRYQRHLFSHPLMNSLRNNNKCNALSPATFNVCQSNEINRGVFQCNATGRYKEAEIQWNVDGQLLTDSPLIEITRQMTLDTPTGTYHYTSTLSIKTNGTPTCRINASRISVNQATDCPRSHGNCSLSSSLISHNK